MRRSIASTNLSQNDYVTMVMDGIEMSFLYTLHHGRYLSQNFLRRLSRVVPECHKVSPAVDFVTSVTIFLVDSLVTTSIMRYDYGSYSVKFFVNGPSIFDNDHRGNNIPNSIAAEEGLT